MVNDLDPIKHLEECDKQQAERNLTIFAVISW